MANASGMGMGMLLVQKIVYLFAGWKEVRIVVIIPVKQVIR